MQARIVNTVQCADPATITQGEDVYSNNAWGKFKLDQSLSYTQCLVQDKNNDDYGWYWSWPGCDYSMYAFPEVFKGTKPWDAGESSLPALSAQIKSFKTLTANITTDTYQFKGTFNLILEGWGTREKRNGANANQGSIT